MDQKIFTIIALSISTIALIVATMNYRRKSGVFIRGSFSVSSSRDGDDDYISDIVLENLKDRAVTIFSIYIRIGHNYYIEIENMKSKPLILKAFETYQKEYGPIEFYSVSNNRIKINELIKNKNIKRQIILSTSDGKYVVPENIKQWSPVWLFFRNFQTAIIHPVRLTHKNISVGGNIRYVVEITGQNDNEEIITIHPKDYELKRFRDFSLTKESLDSKETLQKYLQSQIDQSNLICKKFEIYDMEYWRERNRDFYSGQTVNVKYYNAFQYFILGKIYTLFSYWKLKRKNNRRKKKKVE